MKRDYMTRLERWARWALPRQEAEDVIADYRDIVSDPELLQGLSSPRNVIRPLAPKKPYYTWMAVFLAMAAIILALGFSSTFLGFPVWLYLFHFGDRLPYLGPILAAAGILLALVWFRRKGEKKERLPRAIPVLLTLFLLFTGGIMWFCWACSRDLDAFLAMWGTVKPLVGPNETAPASIYIPQMVMCYGGAVISLVGASALVKARMGDRRWAAVYVLGLTAILTALWTVYLVSYHMDAAAVSGEELFRQMLTRCSVITAMGLVGTGVALC